MFIFNTDSPFSVNSIEWICNQIQQIKSNQFDIWSKENTLIRDADEQNYLHLCLKGNLNNLFIFSKLANCKNGPTFLTHLVHVEYEVQFTDVFKTFIQRFHKHLQWRGFEHHGFKTSACSKEGTFKCC